MEEALANELREEVKIREIGEVKLIGIYLNRHISRRDHVALYHCRDWRKKGLFKPDREIAEIGVFGLDSLPDGITDGTLSRLDEFYNQKTISKYW